MYNLENWNEWVSQNYGYSTLDEIRDEYSSIGKGSEELNNFLQKIIIEYKNYCHKGIDDLEDTELIRYW